MSDRRSPRCLPINRSQHLLLPLDVDRLIDHDHLARRIWRVGSSLDLSRLERDIRAVTTHAVGFECLLNLRGARLEGEMRRQNSENSQAQHVRPLFG